MWEVSNDKNSDPCKKSHAQDSLERTEIPVSVSEKKPTVIDDEVQYVYDYKPIYRFLMLGLYTMISFIMGPPFMNWRPLVELMEFNSPFSVSMCKPSSAGYSISSNGIIRCDEQQIYVKGMETIVVSMMFVFSFLSGIVLDCAGPKICSAMGIIWNMLGWINIGASSIDGYQGYFLGLLFMALGSDASIYGLLPVSDLFPQYEMGVIAIIGAARSLSFYIPILMKNIARHEVAVRDISFFFMALQAVCLVCVLWLVPFHAFPRNTVFPRMANQQCNGQDLQPCESMNKLSEYVKKKPDLSLRCIGSKLRNDFLIISGYFLHLSYIGLLVVSSVTILRTSYYFATHDDHIPDHGSLFEQSMPFTFLPCILFGYLASAFSASLVMAFLAICGSLSMFLVIRHADTANFLQIISILMNFFVASFVSSQFYCYISKVYPQKEMGKLTGMCFLVGGGVGMLSSIMYKAAKGAKVCMYMDILLGVLEFFAAAIMIILFFKVEKVESEPRSEKCIT